MKIRKRKRLGILIVSIDELKDGWGIHFPKGCELNAAIIESRFDEDEEVLKIRFTRPDIVEHQEGTQIPYYTINDIKALNNAS